MRPSKGCRLRWENNINIILKMGRYEGVDLIRLSEDGGGGGGDRRAVLVFV